MLTPAWANTPLGSATLLVDGNMEAVGVRDWTAFSATISKDASIYYRGSQSLKITGTDGASSSRKATQIVTGAKTYRITGRARGDGAVYPTVYDGGSGVFWTGTTSTDWQYFDEVHELINYIGLRVTATNTQSAWFDDVRMVEYKGKEEGSANVLVDGNMENSGVGDWDLSLGATLTKSTADPYRGTQALRVTGPTNCDAKQNVMATYTNYRMTGRARGNGTAYPRLQKATPPNAIWTGTTSTDWQYFDEVINSSNHGYLYFKVLDSGGADWVEFDDVRIEEYKGKQLGSANKIADGNMEADNIDSWTAGAGATVTKQTTNPKRGSQVLRIVRNASNSYARQEVLTAGKAYRVTGVGRGDGTGTGAIIGVGATQYITSSTDWQYFDFTGIATNTNFSLVAATAGQYVEFDDIRVVEIID